MIASALVTAVLAQAPTAVTAGGVSARDVTFYSEAVRCHGRLFLPKGFTPTGKVPAVVLAPASGETAASLEKYAWYFAGRGLVAMTLDYRGWGRSGGLLYLAEPIHVDDRLRFSQHTAKVRIRRKRLIPDAQILDIRNAVSYLQGEPGVDRARIGVWGADLAGGHAIVTAATDVRVKAVVAQAPAIAGRDVPRVAEAPTPERLAAMIRLARSGQAAATAAGAAAMNAREATVALAEYHPFWYVDQIPQSTAVLFVVAEKDAKVNNETNAIAASKLLKGPNGVTIVPGATHAMSNAAFDVAAEAAAAWFQKYL